MVKGGKQDGLHSFQTLHNTKSINNTSAENQLTERTLQAIKEGINIFSLTYNHTLQKHILYYTKQT